jgi:GTPase SAR1 family protein
MDTTQTRRRFPDLQFRVLVIGRANAGKTSILQRVCETTESPTIYRGNEEVRGSNFCVRVRMISLQTSLNLTRRWMLVAAILLFGCL